MDLIKANRSALAANLGTDSENATPGILVEIVSSGPRTSDGACGFGSNVSKWLGPPSSHTRTHRFATPKVASPDGCSDAAASFDRTGPVNAKLPKAKKSRRLKGA